MNAPASPPPDRLGPLLEALSAARVGWFGIHEGTTFPARTAIAETVVPTHRLIALEAGALVYCVEGKAISCRAGALWLVPEWTRRSWRTTEGCRMAWVEFAPLPQVGALPMVHLRQSAWCDPARLLPREEARPFQEMALKLLLMRLLREGRWRSDPLPEDRTLQSVLATLRAHLHEPDLLMRLPGKVGMSPRQLRDRFRNALGTSPGRYLEMLRMQQARYLLLTTGLSIKEVAARTGFDDPLYFSRRYRGFWGSSPKTHRTPNP